MLRNPNRGPLAAEMVDNASKEVEFKLRTIFSIPGVPFLRHYQVTKCSGRQLVLLPFKIITLAVAFATAFFINSMVQRRSQAVQINAEHSDCHV